MTRTPIVLALALSFPLVACHGGTKDTSVTNVGVDADGDGVPTGTDCNDEDPSVGAATTWYTDSDGDGHGDPNSATTSCTAPEGSVATGDDCDDANSDVFPGVVEVCNGIDDDCNGLVDDDDPGVIGQPTWYVDADGDGYGDDGTAFLACAGLPNDASQGGDCNDADAAYHPGAPETDCTDPNDYNCDGSVGYADADGDGYPACQECDDGNAAVNPGATEVCNGVDDNCDGQVDEAGAAGETTFYADLDGDGYGDPAAPSTGCSAPAGTVADDTDCDDSRADINPAAGEICDGLDNDCDTLVDDADPSLDLATASSWYIDGDADGYGAGTATLACAAPAGTSTLDGDCNDADPAYNPAASETDCTDPNDYNCDGSTGYVDADGDGYAACAECDDGNAAINPEATEACDGVDNDCDGVVDESDATDATLWYADNDGDGYGDPATATPGCAAPEGYVANSADCDDYDAGVNPSETEVCNGKDDNCDGVIDESTAADAPTWYTDADSDGYGDPSRDTVSCAPPSGSVADDTDCNDADGTIHPGATEVCNGVDDDCDGGIDEGVTNPWYADTDGDGFGDPASVTATCTQPAGSVADSTDCDDSNAAINPAAAEICDGIDNNCDGLVDNGASDVATWYTDADGDGYGDPASATSACSAPAGAIADNTDCDDRNAAVNPAAVEICDGIDNNCDGSTDGADSWWSADWPYRVIVDVTAAGYDVASPPVLLDVDFRAALDSLGDSTAFDSDGLRVVIQECSSGTMTELPSQFLDDQVGLLDKVASADPVDEHGTVAFLLDQDGDPTSLDVVPAGTTVTIGLYFGGSHAAPAYATDLVAGASAVANTMTTASFDDTRGGMLTTLTFDGSPSLESQADSCCGNSFFGGSWSMDPQDAAGTLTTLFDGPVAAAIQATGERSDSQSGYSYAYTYLMFAGRPEVWSKVYGVTTEDSLLSHPGDITNGIRPYEARHDNISSGASFTTDADYADVSNGTWGMAFAWAQAPTYVITVSNYDPYLIAVGNDYTPAGLGSPATIPAETAFFDNIVQIHLPHAGSFDAAAQSTLLGLQEGVATSARPAEKR